MPKKPSNCSGRCRSSGGKTTSKMSANCPSTNTSPRFPRCAVSFSSFKSSSGSKFDGSGALKLLRSVSANPCRVFCCLVARLGATLRLRSVHVVGARHVANAARVLPEVAFEKALKLTLVVEVMFALKLIDLVRTRQEQSTANGGLTVADRRNKGYIEPQGS